jgi:hypothetical protein
MHAGPGIRQCTELGLVPLAMRPGKMEFRIRTNGSAPDLDAINDALTAIDPSALADVESASATLRISAALGSHDLLAVLAQAGYPVHRKQLEEVAPVCCGGCGG